MLRIGNIQLDAPFVQAALSGYSDAAMRLLARDYGCPYTINEVVLDKLVSVGGKRMKRMLSIPRADHPIGGQLMGSEPQQFAEAGNAMVELGYDVIDINFGCPVKKVLGRCRGGFLLSAPDVARDILRSVYDAVGGRTPVTLKMRRGMDDSAESESNFFSLFEYALEIGIAAITVHGRTVKQRYIGPSNWQFLERVKRHAGDRTMRPELTDVRLLAGRLAIPSYSMSCARF
jgi:tRNA-dihydrouridine synthase B